MNNTNGIVQNKSKFITDILDYSIKKNVDVKTKEWLINLISKEFEKTGIVEMEIIERLSRIEEKLTGTKVNEPEEAEESKNEIKLSKHKPKDVSKFLSLFRGNDHPLKYLIHDYTKPNSQFDIDDFNKAIEASYRNESKNYNIPYSLKGRLTTFIGINKKYYAWFFKNKSNTFSFRNTDVISWCKNNQGKHPIKKFFEDINRFRDSIVIDKNLPEIIKFAVSDTIYFQNIQLHFDEGVESAKYLTDVDALISGLKCIFNSIGQHKSKQSTNHVKISFNTKSTSENRLRILTITHLDSECNRKLDEEIFGGDLKDAKKYFYQLCDWSIIAKNTNSEYNKLNILYDQEIDIQQKEKIDSEIAGFTHILTFYS